MLVPLEVILANQSLDRLLDHWQTGLELGRQLPDNFIYELRVLKLLAVFHHTDDAGLVVVPAVSQRSPPACSSSITHVALRIAQLVNLLIRLTALVIRLDATRDRHDFDFRQWRREGIVERKEICLVDIPTFGILGQNFVFCASESLQRSLELARCHVRERRQVLLFDNGISSKRRKRVSFHPSLTL